jgi:hypothetical protein
MQAAAQGCPVSCVTCCKLRVPHPVPYTHPAIFAGYQQQGQVLCSVQPDDASCWEATSNHAPARRLQAHEQSDRTTPELLLRVHCLNGSFEHWPVALLIGPRGCKCICRLQSSSAGCLLGHWTATRSQSQ